VKVVALLPMKANSERVKGKNFRMMCGKPLFRWVLDALLAVPVIERIIINTDARDILDQHDIGLLSSRILIRDRAYALCGDFVSMNKIIEDDLKSEDADMYVMTHTTNPLLTARTVEQAISLYSDKLLREDADSLFSVDRHQERFYDGAMTPINHDPNELLRTQDLEPLFHENSNLYLFTKESFESSSARIGLRPAMLEMNSLESVDIDTLEDWSLAEALLQQFRREYN
jgi:CMP-N-acetylneuraminic acid synthetase